MLNVYFSMAPVGSFMVMILKEPFIELRMLFIKSYGTWTLWMVYHPASVPTLGFYFVVFFKWPVSHTVSDHSCWSLRWFLMLFLTCSWSSHILPILSTQLVVFLGLLVLFLFSVIFFVVSLLLDNINRTVESWWSFMPTCWLHSGLLHIVFDLLSELISCYFVVSLN